MYPDGNQAKKWAALLAVTAHHGGVEYENRKGHSEN
jgi:hypothetical protein